MSIEAMKQALEALKWASDQTEPETNDHCMCPICKAIDGLIQAIVEAEKQSATHEERDFSCNVCGNKPDADGLLEHGKGCYTQDENGGGVEFIADAVIHSQPKREWVGLTDEKIEKTPPMHSNGGYVAYARAIEAKLKEKNT